MTSSIKEKLEKLKEFRKKLSSDNTKEFDELIASIIEELPDEYRSKINILNLYEFYEEQQIDDLPF